MHYTLRAFIIYINILPLTAAFGSTHIPLTLDDTFQHSHYSLLLQHYLLPLPILLHCLLFYVLPCRMVGHTALPPLGRLTTMDSVGFAYRFDPYLLLPLRTGGVETTPDLPVAVRFFTVENLPQAQLRRSHLTPPAVDVPPRYHLQLSHVAHCHAFWPLHCPFSFHTVRDTGWTPLFILLHYGSCICCAFAHDTFCLFHTLHSHVALLWLFSISHIHIVATFAPHCCPYTIYTLLLLPCHYYVGCCCWIVVDFICVVVLLHSGCLLHVCV